MVWLLSNIDWIGWSYSGTRLIIAKDGEIYV